MSEPTGVPGKQKIDLAIQAADLYVGLLKDNDRIGLVRFNQNAANPGDVAILGDEDAVRAGVQRVFDAGGTEFSGALFGSREDVERTRALLKELATS